MSLHQLRFLMERLWLTVKPCDIFRATAVNLGIICSNLKQRKSSRRRNSQDLIGIFCSGPFAPLYHELTLNEWAASQRGKSHHTVCMAFRLCGQRGMQEAELVGPPRSSGALELLWVRKWLWGCLGLVYSGGSAASALLSSPSTVLHQPPYSPREKVVPSSGAPAAPYEQNPLDFAQGAIYSLQRCAMSPVPTCVWSSIHFCIAKENHFSHPK